MPTLTIAAAQSISVAGDLPGNIARHLDFMASAAEQGVQLLVFPELSLTGYEPERAFDLAAACGVGEQLVIARRTGQVWSGRVVGVVCS